MSVDDLLEAVRTGSRNASSARTKLSEAQLLLAGTLTALKQVIEETRATDAAAALNLLEQAALQHIATYQEHIRDAIALLHEYLHRISGDTTTPSTEAPGVKAPPAAEIGPANSAQDPRAGPTLDATTRGAFTNRHGDSYPVDATDLAKDVPARVIPGNGDRTVGIASWRGHRITIVSGSSGSAEADALLKKTGHGSGAAILKHHVEIKLAAMILSKDHLDHVEVAINYTPCGIETSRRWAAVCDKGPDQAVPTRRRPQPHRLRYLPGQHAVPETLRETDTVNSDPDLDEVRRDQHATLATLRAVPDPLALLHSVTYPDTDTGQPAGAVWQFETSDTGEGSLFLVGVRGDRGTLTWYAAGTGTEYVPVGTDDHGDWHDYWAAGHQAGWHDGAELPLEAIHAALSEYIATGQRPTTIRWTDAESIPSTHRDTSDAAQQEFLRATEEFHPGSH